MTCRPNVPFMLTVDVEPDWGIAGCRCVEETLPRFCGLLARYGVRGTFFVVANLVEQIRDQLRDAATVHEIGSHGLTHRLLTDMSRAEVSVELSESRRRLQEELGAEVIGFRAPFLKTPPRWFENVSEAGYRYDSSWGSVVPSPGNVGPNHWRPVRRHGIVEIPTTALRSGWIPFSLTYLRLLAPFGEALVSPCAAMMYLHLHELADPSHANVLPMPLRAVLRRGAGPRAWAMLDRILRRVAPRAVTCREFLAMNEEALD